MPKRSLSDAVDETLKRRANDTVRVTGELLQRDDFSQQLRVTIVPQVQRVNFVN